MRALVISCIAIGMGLLAACGGARVTAVTPAATQPVKLLDALIVATAESAVVRADVIDAVWLGHWQSRGFVLYRPGIAAYLYSTSGGPPEFVPLPAAALPAALKGRFYEYQGAWRGLRGGVVPIDPNASPLSMAVSVGNWATPLLEALIHESFHGWQVREFASYFDPETPQRLPNATRLASDHAVRVEAEREALRSVLSAELHPTVREEARRYLALRSSRMAASDPLLERVERMQERIEGIAEYVGITSYHAARGAPVKSVRATLLVRIADNVRWGSAEATSAKQLHARTYLSGAAIAYALDQLSCLGWRQGVTANQPLDELLAACLEL